VFLSPFFDLLRSYGIPVSLTEIIDFYKGLEKGLGPDLESLYVFARLSFVRRVEHMDAFDRAYAYYFYGLDLPKVAEGDPELLNTDQFREWLRKAIEKGELPPQAIWSFSPEELMKRFWETMREQMKEHHGGSKWIGTGGNSPFGHSGNSQGGVRVFGSSGGRSALKVIGERRYVDYAEDGQLRAENLRQALATLKKLVPAGPHSHLDVDATIDESARNGGEIELVFRRELRDRIDVILLIDNGGSSMLQHFQTTRMLFSKIKDRFHRLSTFYFRNTVYGNVFRDPQRRIAVETEELLRRNPDTRLLILGDAAMAPHELAMPQGAIEWGVDDKEPSIHWLRRLRERFPRSIWLNPIPKDHWHEAWGQATIQKVAEVFEMEDLTLGGIRNAVSYLNDR
jgi:uncharacterized protein with von Willebrand factor type A (vWA) domain